MIQNKESCLRLKFKDVTIDAKGISLTNLLQSKEHNIDLNVVHMENVNIDERGLKTIIKACKKMKGLKELRLINMHLGVGNSMQWVEKAFKRHPTLEILDLSNNDLKDYCHVAKILEKNRCIKKVNVRGNDMNGDQFATIYFALSENFSVIEIKH